MGYIEPGKVSFFTSKQNDASNYGKSLVWSTTIKQKYKNKNLANENKITQLSDNLKILHNKIEMAELKIVELEKINSLKEDKLSTVKTYSENLEAQLSDVKDFVFKNCTDQLDAFWVQFKDYYQK